MSRGQRRNRLVRVGQGDVQLDRRTAVPGDEQRNLGWRERRKVAKRRKAERTGDTPEKRAEHKASDQDAKDAASGAAIRGTVGTPPGVGGLGGGAGF
jgi:hypothetical protein